MFMLIDLTLLFGILSLIFYILVVVAILPATLTSLSYIFLIVAIVLFVTWFALRIVGTCANGRYSRNSSIV